ncbi:hypothetical protein HU200_018539 [Digitaria exilis]|uniref:Uncharacterized protein n=1 Tax=Digitaria exilis TaxID=1010633 RepID=A0A835F4C7_9POAL|nr:hypothetical protein HU200_018539 [Digitaria exilis]
MSWLSAARDGGGSSHQLSWALQAAMEAEAAATTDCSGHGRVYLDSVAGEDGRPGCECNGCFHGPDCSRRTLNCTADAESADQMFMEPYWMRHAAESAVVVSGWHRLSYFATDGEYQSVELERHIRRLHRAVGNAVADDKHIVFGTGSMKLINALVHALSPDDGTISSPGMVVATAPYYAPYRTQTMMFDGREYKWEGTTEAWAANASSSHPSNSSTFIEFVTSPNNPDFLLRKPVLGGRVIADHAYYWPHFTPIPSPADEDVMLFSASKLSGHAGSRFGWALVRDEKVALRAKEYIEESSLGESRDTQLRMLSIIKVILANLHGKEDMFAFAHEEMSTRWTRFNTVVSGSRRISVQKISPQFCTYLNRTREPTPAFAWVKCERKQDQDCYDALLKANIISWSGVDGEASARYTRVSLVKARDDFDVLLERLTDFVNDEKKQSAPTSSIRLPSDQLIQQ